MTTENSIAHLEAIRHDARDEIKRRIEQRDKYSIQLTIALGTIVAVSFGGVGFDKVLIAAPLVSIYFTALILYSYRIHGFLAQYLREALEPELSQLCGTPLRIEWETYYKTLAIPGIRRTFFMIALWMVYTLTIGYLLAKEYWLSESTGADWQIALIGAAFIYMAVNARITSAFWRN